MTQTLMLAEPSDNAGARDTSGGYTTDETPEAMPLSSTQLGEMEISAGLLPSDYVRVSEEPSLECQKDTQENTRDQGLKCKRRFARFGI